MLRWFRWINIPLVLGLLALGYHFTSNFSDAITPDSKGWSRPVFLGRTDHAGATVPVALANGEAITFTSTATGIDYAVVDAGASVKAAGRLQLPAANRSQLSALGGDHVRLFWLEPSAGSAHRLLQATVDGAGTVTAGPEEVLPSVLSYVVRTPAGGGGAVLLTHDDRAIQVFPPIGEGWGAPLSTNDLGGTVKSIDAQVLADGRIVAAAHVQAADDRDLIVALEGTVAGGLKQTTVVAELNEGVVQPVRVGVDRSANYIFYTVNTVERAAKVTRTWMATSPAPSRTFTVQALEEAGRLTERIRGGELLNPTVRPGQHDELQVAFLAPTASRRDQNLGLVLATFRGGHLASKELVHHNPGALRPAIAAGEGRRYITFASFAGDGAYNLHVVSDTPAFIQATLKTGWDDVTQATLETLFGMFAAIYPLIQGGLWLVPMLSAVGLLHIFALTWAEQNPRKIFWTGVALALPMQAYTAHSFLTRLDYVQQLPTWLSVSAVSVTIYMAVGLLTLCHVVKRFGSAKTGAFAPLVFWGVATLTLNAIFFGPFIRP